MNKSNVSLDERLKKVQMRFMNKSDCSDHGIVLSYITAEEVDKIRERVLKPIYSKKFKQWF